MCGAKMAGAHVHHAAAFEPHAAAGAVDCDQVGEVGRGKRCERWPRVPWSIRVHLVRVAMQTSRAWLRDARTWEGEG